MAKRSTPSDKVKIDPLFVIPDGAEDQFAYSREEYAVEETSEDNLAIDSVDDYTETADDSLDYDDGYGDQDATILEIPENFSIISQVLRRAPGGQQVVDIVIETEDIPGAINYEIQVTKV